MYKENMEIEDQFSNNRGMLPGLIKDKIHFSHIKILIK